LIARGSAARIVGGLAGIVGAGAASGRAGGGGHSGSIAASSGVHSGSVSNANGSFGGLIVIIMIAIIVWLVIRRLRTHYPASGTFDGVGTATSTLGAVIGAAGGRRADFAAGSPGSPYPSLAGVRPQLPAGIDAIRAQDPGFEIETFLQRAEMTFFLVKRGMQKADPAAVRPYLNDAVFALVSGYIGQMKQQHRHALFESMNVRALHVDTAGCSDQGQVIRIHFDLVYRLKTFDDANRVVADEGTDGRHGECWTFARAAGARTPANGDVTAARCPACGAELRLNLDGTCLHCRASVTNGSVDWVVADVQPAAFIGYSSESPLPAAPSVAAGVATLCAADPTFSAAAFLARAQQAFLTLQDAWCRQQLDAGRAFLSPGAYFSWSAQLEALAAEGRRNVMADLRVLGIDIIRVVHGGVFDDLTVHISAEAADFEIDRNDNIVFGDRTVRPFTEAWTFQRSIGVATTTKPGTLESTCPACGAPVALTQIGECRYCKAAVTSGKFDWVVSRIDQEDGALAENPGADLAMQVGGAIVGSLLGSILSGASSRGGSGDKW
jgi:predicted lipid-binding transport protein (Tim44 family)